MCVCFNLHMGNAEAVRFLNGAVGLSLYSAAYADLHLAASWLERNLWNHIFTLVAAYRNMYSLEVEEK